MRSEMQGASTPASPTAFVHAKPLIVSIEGNIGAGKTTVVESLKKLFKENKRVAVLKEPVEEWEANGFLAAMYENRVDASSFQHCVLMSLAGDLLHKLNESDYVLIITERSAKGNYHVFGKANLTPGTVEHDLYKFSYDRIIKGLMTPALRQSFIHLKASTEIVKKRMAERGRGSEKDVANSYLDKLGILHDRWLSDEVDVTTVYVDNLEKEDVLKQVKMHINMALSNFLSKETALTTKQQQSLISAMALLAP